jgi:hypothetical protein
MVANKKVRSKRVNSNRSLNRKNRKNKKNMKRSVGMSGGRKPRSNKGKKRGPYKKRSNIKKSKSRTQNLINKNKKKRMSKRKLQSGGSKMMEKVNKISGELNSLRSEIEKQMKENAKAEAGMLLNSDGAKIEDTSEESKNEAKNVSSEETKDASNVGNVSNANSSESTDTQQSNVSAENQPKPASGGFVEKLLSKAIDFVK